MSKKLKITLVKSVIGRKPKHVEIVRQLGLKKMNSMNGYWLTRERMEYHH